MHVDEPTPFAAEVIEGGGALPFMLWCRRKVVRVDTPTECLA
jgi:hypothetical protein